MNNSTPDATDIPLVQSDSSNHVPFPTDSTRRGDARASKFSTNSESTSSDKLSALPGPASPPNSRNRAGHNAILSSSSAPSSQSSLAGRHLPPSSDLDPLKTKDGSGSKNSSHHHVSFEGNRALSNTPSHTPHSNVHVHPSLREAVSAPSRGLDSTLSRMHRASDPQRPPSIVRVAANSSRKASVDSAMSPSHSRATSPMRIFSWSPFHRTHTREDPFIPVDPFQLRVRLARFSIHSPDLESGRLPFDPTCDDTFFCCLQPPSCNPKDRFLSFLHTSRYFLADTIPRQIYLYLLLRLPSLYFSRIARVYEDAEVSKPDIQRMIDACSFFPEQRPRTSSPIPPGAHYHPGPSLPFPDEWTTANVSPALVRFKQSWEAFVDSLLREWKTLNLVSALLLSAILSMFQSNEMSGDPVTRTAALLSLTCALMSLSYGCVYIVRFGTMRSMYKATRWAEEAQRTTTFILWNVWVLLAMPAVWLAWSMIFFITAILSFVWRTGSTSDPTDPAPLSPDAALGPRIVISAVFFLGLVYFIAIVKTLHTYGRVREHGRRHVMHSTREADGQDGLGERAHEHVRERERGRESERERERERERGRNRDREDRDRETSRSSRGRERTRRSDRDKNDREREHAELERTMPTEPGGLSAVTGLGLRGLDGFASPQGSDEVTGEKRRADSLASF